MPDRDPTIITSPLSRLINRDDVAVEVLIYRLERDRRWALEVVNEKGTSIVWDDLFKTDAQAFAAFEKVVEEEGMKAFLDDDDDLETLH